MTEAKSFSILLPALTNGQQKDEEAITRRLLSPLKSGKAVVLKVVDPQLPKRKRIESSPRLFLIPSQAVGDGAGMLMVAFEAYGCEVLKVPEGITPTSLNRVGLNMLLSIALAEALSDILGV